MTAIASKIISMLIQGVIIITLALGIFIGGCVHGEKRLQFKLSDELTQQRNKELKLIKKLEEANEELDKQKETTITVIEKIVDPTGCLDTPMPDAFIEQLHAN